jgi:hypothetical protein
MGGATERALAPCIDNHLPLILMARCRAHPQLDLRRQQRIAELVVAGASYWAEGCTLIGRHPVVACRLPPLVSGTCDRRSQPPLVVP